MVAPPDWEEDRNKEQDAKRQTDDIDIAAPEGSSGRGNWNALLSEGRVMGFMGLLDRHQLGDAALDPAPEFGSLIQNVDDAADQAGPDSYCDGGKA